MHTIYRFFLSAAIMVGCSMMMYSATVPEPSTVIYGKVLNRVNGAEYQLTKGTLVWVLSGQDGKLYTYTTELEDVRGTFSYRIGIPHQVVASGLTVDPKVVPLGLSENAYRFASITVDGKPARILTTETDFVKLFQKARGATYRIDLQIGFDLDDTDGDGMPDWWEKLHGLDFQVRDGDGDSDGDGWNNLKEYLSGTSPLRDDRAPIILTRSVAAYGESASGVWIRTIDTDTPPSGLVYTVTALPGGGTLLLAGVNGVASSLGVGSTFTQAQVNQGLVSFQHVDPSINKTTFGVSVSDSSHAPYVSTLDLAVFPPSPAAAPTAAAKTPPAWWRDENAVFKAYWGYRENLLTGDIVESALLYVLGKSYGWTLWDERTETLPLLLSVPGSGSNFILGGDAADTVTGGPSDDIIDGGPGNDTLRGGNGVDLFIISDVGTDTIEDFNVTHDAIDLGSLLAGEQGTLNSRLRATNNGTDTEIGLDRNGDGSGFTDAVIRLKGVQLVQEDLHRLWSTGQLLLGAVQGLPSVTIDGWPSRPLEEGFSSASLTFRRNGPVTAPLTISLLISGSATNGVDYNLIPSSLTFLAGQSTISVPVTPLIDGNAEFIEQINISLAASSSFVKGALSSGEIQIEDAKQRFNLKAVPAVTAVDQDPAYIQILRQGPRTGVIQLLLSISGTAVRNQDFKAIPTLVTFADNQASVFLPVEALALGALGSGEKSRTVTATLRPATGDEYLLGLTPTASVTLLSKMSDFETWMAESMPEVAASTGGISLTRVNSPRSGMSALLEYAGSFGLVLSDGVSPAERELMTPKLVKASSGMEFEFSKRLNDPRLEYIVERSADLKEWVSGPEFFQAVPLSAAQENAGRVRLKVLEPPGLSRPFMRVRVNLKD